MATPQAKLQIPSPATPLVTIEQYLAQERRATERHEYLDGRLYRMAGESPEHADISADLVMLIGTQLGDGPCRVRTKDSKVRSGLMPVPRDSTKGLFSYPDLVVICGEPEYLDAHRDVITNPTLIIEVMSESTALFDLREKFFRYQIYNPTLLEYLLVRQDMPAVEVFERQRDGSWRYTPHMDLAQSAKLNSIKCVLPLARVYRRVAFALPNEPAKVSPSKKTPRKRAKK